MVSVFPYFQTKFCCLKRLLAIPLLAIYLFNTVGYQLLFSLLIQHSDKLLVQRLDQNQYDDNDLLQIKIPLHLPYYSSQSDYERLDGEANYKGVAYRYVKRKVANDTLYILCLKNEAKTQLKGAQTDYAKKATDLPVEKNNSSNKKMNYLGEHHSHQAEYSFAAAVRTLSQHRWLFVSPLCSLTLEGNLKPPQAAV